MIWRQWQRYVQLTEGLTLESNFISRAHYLTLELPAHAGVNHQLALFRSFPQLPAQEYSIRNTRNRGIEAIHGMFHGGTTSLPITSPNLSFQQFLSRMNQALQIHTAEHSLKQIQGNPIVASKKKQLTNAIHSIDSSSQFSYTKRPSYSEFLTELDAACTEGDKLAKQTIEQLAPEMVKELRKHKEWEKPKLCIEAAEKQGNVNILQDADMLAIASRSRVASKTNTACTWLC